MTSFTGSKAPDLIGYVKLALNVGHWVDPLLLHAVKLQRSGGLRRALQKEGARGKRGSGRGDHQQLWLAREMWKQIHLARVRPITAAAQKVATGSSNAIRAYYRFTKPRERSILYVELTRELFEAPCAWEQLAGCDETVLKEALIQLRRLKDQ